jgi:hypothetical protein
MVMTRLPRAFSMLWMACQERLQRHQGYEDPNQRREID